MKASSRAAFTVLAGALVVAALPARGQRVVRVGSFDVRVQMDPATGRDQGVSASVLPAGEPLEGLMIWRCGAAGLAVTLELDASPAHGATRRVAWRFDGGPPDSTLLQRGTGPMWRVPEGEVAELTRRARTAARLVIQAPRPRVSAGTDYTYDLAGSAAALGNLSCALDPSAPPLPAPRPPSRPPRDDDGPAPGPVTRTTPPDEGTYELSAVEVMPRITNAPEIQRMLIQGFPAQLRGTGIAGSVTLRFRVLENGRVDAEKPVEVISSTHEAFNEPAILAVRRLVLTPARVNGRPVRVWVELPIAFEADFTEPDSAASPPPVP